MTATKLFKAGYTDLVSVIPPGAELSPLSKVKPESAGKAPGRKNPQGRWVGYAWQNESCTEAQAAQMDADKANVGLKAGFFPGVDIDCTDETIAETIQRIAIETLGAAPVRVGQAPKRLLMYCATEPFGRMRLWFTVAGKQHLVEVLGEGQQYVVQGIHPRTQKPYTWTYGEASRTYPPVKPEKLTQISKDAVEVFLSAVQEELDLLDVVCTREGSGNVAAQRNVAQDSLKAPTMADLAAAVDVIPNDTPSREEYIRMGYAIKAAAQDDEEAGYGVFLEWCQRWEGGENDPFTVRGDWERMHPPYELGWDFIAQTASRYGYNYARTEFEAIAQPEEPAEEALIAAHLSDMWLTDRVIAVYGETIKWVPAWGKWLFWDGHCWRKDELSKIPSLVIHICKETSDKLLRSAVTDKEQAAALKKAQQISSAKTVQSVLTLLRADERLVVRAEVLDADPWVMGTPGGVIDLKTGEILSAEPMRYVSKLAAITPNYRAPAPMWQAFIKEVTGGDKDLAAYLQRLAGYCLTGLVSEHTLAFLWGPGGNGKSVFVNTLTGILGEYARTAPMETFTASMNDRHPTELAGLQGARLVAASETQEGRAWDEAKVKSITGGDPITARYMHKDFFTFEPTFKLVFLGNHKPEIRNLDDAMRRRFHMVPFTIKPKTVNTELFSQLKAEWPSIFAWMVEGCLAWQKTGLAAPAAVLDATREYFEDEDAVGRWLTERCIVGQTFFASSVDLYSDWKSWCIDNGEKYRTKKWLGQMLMAKGFETFRRADSRGFKGLEVKDPLESRALAQLESL